MYLDLNIFTAFLNNKNIIFKIRRSKVTDYAALKLLFSLQVFFSFSVLPNSIKEAVFGIIV